MNTKTLLVWACLSALAACGSGSGEDGSTKSNDDVGGSVDFEDGVQFDGDGPVVVTSRAWCQAGSDSSGMIFFFEVDYADPQGDYDVENGDVTGRYVSGGDIFTDRLLICRDGECVGSFRDGHYPPITCSTASDFAFSAVLYDRSGNASAPMEIPWEG